MAKTTEPICGTCNAWRGKTLAFGGDPERPCYGQWWPKGQACGRGPGKGSVARLPRIGGGLEEPGEGES